jgi:phenylacetate-coenzyme A ligase PaaK-like adenylate-forming protein
MLVGLIARPGKEYLSLPSPFPRSDAQSWLPRLIVSLGLRRRLALLAERQERHRQITDPGEIAAWQLLAFNSVWRMATRRYRFYAEWQQRHRLPDRLADIGELSRFPILRKADIEANFETIAEDARPCRFIGTGGSTGPSTWFPRGPEDHALLHSNMYLGRSAAGITPGDNIVLVWGHEHLHGLGMKGRFNRAKRRWMDRLIGTERLSAYHLDDLSVSSYFARIRARPGAVVVGYVSALRKLLDWVESSGLDGREARIHAVIFCSETVFASDLARVRSLLGAVPLIEYGMGELGVMAYSSPGADALTFLWDAFHGHVGEANELIVTALQPFRFPLINYGTGDRVQILADAPALPFRCARIAGRTRTVLGLTRRDGRMTEVHSELLEDCLDLVPEVRSYFIHQKGDMIEIAVRTSGRQSLESLRRRFLAILARHDADIDGSKLIFSPLVEEPYTVAGKRCYVVRD